MSRLDIPCETLNLLPSGYASAACTAVLLAKAKALCVAPPRCVRERGRDGRIGNFGRRAKGDARDWTSTEVTTTQTWEKDVCSNR